MSGLGFDICYDCGAGKRIDQPCTLCASEEGPAERKALAEHRSYVAAERAATSCPVCLTVKEIGDLCPRACSSIAPAATKRAHGRCHRCGGSGHALRMVFGGIDELDICDVCAGSGDAA